MPDSPLLCPAGDADLVPGVQNRSPDFNFDGVVNLVDLATFATGYPPQPPLNFCVDLNCDGIINLVDLALFAIHYLHLGAVLGLCN